MAARLKCTSFRDIVNCENVKKKARVEESVEIEGKTYTVLVLSELPF